MHNINLHKVTIKNFISKLVELKLIHTHGVNFGDLDENNDPTIIELTFLNNKFFKANNEINYNSANDKLDFPNKTTREDIKLYFEKN